MLALAPSAVLKLSKNPTIKGTHKSPTSPPTLLWNQAFKSGSVTVSFNSWAITLAMASAALLPLGLGLISRQLLFVARHLSGLPTKLYLISVPSRVVLEW